jgi:hypothetical protein
MFKFKYIEGKMIENEEHMLFAKEIAEVYHLYSLQGKPNGLLVKHILKDNLCSFLPEYYYPYSNGVARVYPKMHYHKILSEFISNICIGNGIYQTIDESGKSIKINYKYTGEE